MIKILVIGDLHASDLKPQMRIDNFNETQMNKIQEIMEIGKNNKVDFYIFLGDIVHKPELSYRTLCDIIKILKKNIILKYTLVGNHDIFGLNEGTLYRTVSGILSEFGMLHILDEKLIEDEKVIIKGVHAFSSKNYQFANGYKDYLKIICSHDMITPEECIFKSTPIEKVVTNADLIISGDYHIPFDIYKGHTQFINPGIIIRHNSNERDIKPSVILLEIEHRKYQIKKIVLKSTPENAFDIKTIQEEKTFEKFVDSIRSVKFSSLDLSAEVDKIGKENNISQEIINEIKRRLDGHRELAKVN